MTGNWKMDKILGQAEVITTQIEELEKAGVREEKEMERLKHNLRSLMSQPDHSDLVISTKTKKFPACKNVLAGKEEFHLYQMMNIPC